VATALRSIRETIVREVKEETGLDVEPQSIVGVYSNPRHVVEYGDGEVRQQFSVCFACKVVGGRLATSDESLEVGFFAPAEIESLPMHDLDPPSHPALPGGPAVGRDRLSYAWSSCRSLPSMWSIERASSS
jgi:8-oxo-dGTP pyrophosphatase MutT (NUDIX family)